LVGGPGERDAGGELRDDQRHERLPDRHQNPQPDPDRPPGHQHIVIGAGDPDGNRMNANEIANTWKEPSVRFSSGL